MSRRLAAGRSAPLGGAVLLLAWMGASGCSVSRSSDPPTAGFERGGIPELRGERVLLLPVQLQTAGHPDLELELEFALRQAVPRADWVGPGATREILLRSPGVGIRIDDLPVRGFLAGELQRVGDPLFGDLYRLGVIVGASWALLPVEARGRSGAGGEETIELVSALLDTRTGRVVWFGIVEGQPGDAGALATASSAAEALARRIGG